MNVCINNRKVKYNRNSYFVKLFSLITIQQYNRPSSHHHQKIKICDPHPPASTFLKYLHPLPNLKGGACHALSRTLLMGYSWRNPNWGSDDMEFPGVLKKNDENFPRLIKKEVEFPGVIKRK